MHSTEQSRWQAMIIDRLANELGEDDAVLLEQHLDDCESCMRAARELAGVLGRAFEPAEWAADPALEERLVAALRDRPNPAVRGDSVPADRRDSVAQRLGRGLLDAMAGLSARPLSAYAAIALILIAAAAGFWTGRGRPESSPVDTDLAVLDWTEAPADANRVPPPRSGAQRWAAELLASSPSFARATDHAPVRGADVGFVPARSDAVEPPGRMPVDSL